MHGFELQLLPVTAPGVEQKATWLQIRQSRPDYVLLWGWGVMNSTALKEAQADRLSAREDVRRLVGRRRARRQGRRRRRQGLQRAGAAARRRAELQGRQGHAGAWCTTRARAPGPKEEVGSVLYMRGADDRRCSASKACARAQERYGKGKVMTGEQVALGPGEPGARPEEARRARLRRRDAADLDLAAPTTWAPTWARVHTWDGSEVGLHAPTGCRPTSRSSSRWSRHAADKYAARRS